MKHFKILSALSMVTLVVVGSVSAKAQDNTMLENELNEIKATVAKIAADAVKDEVRDCLINKSNEIIAKQEFQDKLMKCIINETQPKTIQGLTNEEADCFSLRYSLLRNVTDLCASKMQQ